MKTSTLRAFSAGVSLATLGFVMPAFVTPVAAQNVNNGSTQTGPVNLYEVPGTYSYEAPISGDGSPDINGDPFDTMTPPDGLAAVTCYDENDLGCANPGGI